MSGMSIGLSGLRVALAGLETVGNNIANAATPGYHRQEVRVVPLTAGIGTTLQTGGGAEVAQLQRIYNSVAENEILRQQPLQAQTAQELATLQSAEAVLGDLTSGGLGTTLDAFFTALTELTTQPDSPALRDQVVSAADALAAQFRSTAAGLDRLGQTTRVEAETLIDQVNGLTTEIAELNRRVRDLFYRGTPDNNLLDQRAQAIARLSELLDIQVQEGSEGSINILAGGTALVAREKATALDVGLDENGRLGFAVAGTGQYDSQITGGRLGGLAALTNDLLPAIAETVDTLAAELVSRTNAVHVQGAGLTGSFSELKGWMMPEDLGEWEPPLAAGEIHIRLIDSATGDVRREVVTVDPASADPGRSTLTGIAAQFNAIAGLSAQVTTSGLRLAADGGMQFDFLPTVGPSPTTSTLAPGSAVPTFSGTYAGEANEAFTFRVVGTGTVGVTPGLSLDVIDSAGNTVTRLAVGLGYAAGDTLDVVDGLRLQLAAGPLADGQTFTVEALASADTSGLLAGAGINAFFRGNSAASIQVAADLLQSSDRLATSLTGDAADNLNARRLADLADVGIDALGGDTAPDAFRRLATAVGQQIAVRQARQEGLDHTLTQLAAQRDSASGVDMNEEAAKLILFEQLFQSMARYLATLDRAQQSLFEVL